MSELSGKIAIVTGGAGGIGRGTVEAFVEEGAKVVIADVDMARGEALAAALGKAAAFRRTDVSKTKDIQELVDFTVGHFGGLDIIFNNAGIVGLTRGRFADDDLQDFQQVMAVNLLGVMLGSQYAARHMAKHGGGSIINTGSIGGILAGPGVASYRASKAAVNHFSKCIAIEYAELGIRVNCINPGTIVTDMMLAVPGLEQEAAEKLGRELSDIMMVRQPLKRRGSARDIANMAVYLASDRSAQVTGQTIAVDGGQTAGDMIMYEEQLNRARRRAFESKRS